MNMRQLKLRRFYRLPTAVVVTVLGMLTLTSPLGFASGYMGFDGNLIAPPPCKVNDTDSLDVHFGDRLGVKKIDGVAYAKPLVFRLECEDKSAKGWKLILSLNGPVSPFDTEVFKTTSLGANKSNEANLGIRIYQDNGTVFKPKSQIEIRDAENPPKLMAVPVKRPGSVLVEGDFETLVTLQAHYE